MFPRRCSAILGDVTWILIKLGIRFLVFGAVFGVVTWKHKKVTVDPRCALPLIAADFALLDTGLYWLLKPILNLATLGTMAFVMPFILNGVFLYITERLVKKMRMELRLEGLWTKIVLAGLLTIAHGVLWVALDKIDW